MSRGNFFKIWQKLSLGLIVLCSMAPAWSTDSHQRCALILGAEFHGQNFDEVTLAMRDPYLPAFAKNEALFIYWNNLLQNLKTKQVDRLLPIPTAPFSNEVDALRYFTLVPTTVLAELPQEVKTVAPTIIAKLEKQTAILMEQLRALNRSDLTLYDKGILNVLLPWVMVHLAQQGIQVQLCYNGLSVFMRLDHTGAHPLNRFLAARMWQDYQTSLIFHAGTTTFWADKAKFSAMKGKAIILPLALIIRPQWGGGIIRSLQKAKRFDASRLIDSPFNGCAVGVGLGQNTAREDPVFYFNNPQNFHYDFRYFWQRFQAAWDREDPEAALVFLRSSLKEVQKISSVGQNLSLSYIALWRGLINKLPPSAFKAKVMPNGKGVTQVRLYILLRDAVAALPEILAPHCQGGIRKEKLINLRFIFPAERITSAECDAALLKVIDQQLAISETYFKQRLPVVSQIEVFLSSLRDSIKQVEPKKRAEYVHNAKTNPLYQSLFAMISEEFDPRHFDPSWRPSVSTLVTQNPIAAGSL